MTTDPTMLSKEDLANYAYLHMPYGPPQLSEQANADGSIILSSDISLPAVEQSIPHLFKQKVDLHPQRLWLAEKDSEGGWLKITYGEFDQKSDSIAQWLIDHDFGPHTPFMVLSENSIDHALVIMGAMKARVPIASISAPYSLMDKSFAKLKLVAGILKPKGIYAHCGKRFGAALTALEDETQSVIVSQNAGAKQIDLNTMFQVRNSSEVADSIEKITPNTIAKYMFTSGSTGSPKCVVQTQHNICSQVAGFKAIMHIPDPENYAPVSLQWMPWSHVSAGNIAFNEVMLNGGAIYIDDGKPVPGLFEKTLENLRHVSTNVFGSAPIGLSWLATALEGDKELQRVFFKNLQMITYGGAALPEDVANRLQRLAIANTDKRVPIISMYGSTETQGITATHWPTDLAGVIGLPMPGMQLKLVPGGGKLEVRVKGPTVMQEYLNEPELTAAAFDDEGYFQLGDAVRFADEENHIEGLIFDGRISEDFKLLSGTWVSTVSIKEKLQKTLGSLIRDMVVCGENQNFVSVLAWLDIKSASKLTGIEGIDALLEDERIISALQERLNEYNQQNPGSSKRVKSLVLLRTEASMQDAEINEKRYINTKVVAATRKSVLDYIYQHEDGLGVIAEVGDKS